MAALPPMIPGIGPPPRVWDQPRKEAEVEKPEVPVVSADTNGSPSVLVTFFRDRFASALKTKTMSLPELRDLIVTTNADKKDNLPWLKLAKFGDQRSADNSLRHDANVLAITGAEVDYDKKQIPFDDAVRVIKEAHLQALLYPSPGYTIEQPKWRILLPTSKELPPTERAKLVARVNGLFDGAFASESFSLSQSYYYGSVNNNPAHRVEIVDSSTSAVTLTPAPSIVRPTQIIKMLVAPPAPRTGPRCWKTFTTTASCTTAPETLPPSLLWPALTLALL
jgi:hypothetical protein